MVRSFLCNGRKRYGTNTSRQRHDDAHHPSDNTAIESFDRGVEPDLWDQPEDSPEVAQAGNGRRSQNRAKGCNTPLSDALLSGEPAKTSGLHLVVIRRYDPVSTARQIEDGFQIVMFVAM